MELSETVNGKLNVSSLLFPTVEHSFLRPNYFTRFNEYKFYYKYMKQPTFYLFPVHVDGFKVTLCKCYTPILIKLCILVQL